MKDVEKYKVSISPSVAAGNNSTKNVKKIPFLSLTTILSYSTRSIGDISALQSMLLTDLNLQDCFELTGTSLSCYIWDTMGKTVLLQGNT